MLFCVWQQRSEDPCSIIFKGVLGKYMAWLHFGSKYPDIRPELDHKILPVAQSVLTPLLSSPPAHLEPRAHPCGAVENMVLALHKRGFREKLLGRETATVCVQWVEGRREGRPGRIGPRKSRWMTKPASLRQVLLTQSKRFRGIDGLLNTTTVSCSSPPLLMYAGAR